VHEAAYTTGCYFKFKNFFLYHGNKSSTEGAILPLLLFLIISKTNMTSAHLCYYCEKGQGEYKKGGTEHAGSGHF